MKRPPARVARAARSVTGPDWMGVWGRMVQFVRLGLFALVLGIIVLVGLTIYYGIDPTLPHPDVLADTKALHSTRVFDRSGLSLGEVGASRHNPVPIDKMSPLLVNAAAARDPGFLGGSGFHLVGLLKTTLRTLVPAAFEAPFITVTHELLRVGMRRPHDTFRTRLQEISLVARIMWSFSRRQIIELYLNHADFSPAVTGCEAAAQNLFARPASGLDLAQSTFLVGLLRQIPRPDPRRQMLESKSLQCQVIADLAKQHAIDAGPSRRLCLEPIVIAPTPRPTLSFAPEIIDRVRADLVQQHGADRVDTLGIKVKTSIDLGIQTAGVDLLEKELETLDGRMGIRGPSGHLKGQALKQQRTKLGDEFRAGLKPGAVIEAIVGNVEPDPRRPEAGRIYVDLGGTPGLVDLADEGRYTQADLPLIGRFSSGDLVRVRLAPERLAPGVGAAPVELPVALELGPQAVAIAIDPRNRALIAVVGGHGFRAGNIDRTIRRRGAGHLFDPLLWAAAVDTRHATARELRAPILQGAAPDHEDLLSRIGQATSRDFLGRVGIDFSPEIKSSPLEVATAFALLAGGGVPGIPTLSANATPPVGVPIVSPTTAFIATSLLTSVSDSGFLRALASRFPGRPLAAYAAVSARNEDAWFIAYTPDLLVVAWVGFDDGRPLPRIPGDPHPAVAFGAAFLARTLADIKPSQFERPDGVVVRRIDPRNGHICPASRAGCADDFFLAGTEPRPRPGDDEDDVVNTKNVPSSTENDDAKRPDLR